MGRPRTISDESLLQQARLQFEAKGFAASTKEIAKAAGVSEAVLFQRFETKERLFFTAMLPPTPDLAKILGKPPSTPAGTREHLIALAGRLLRHLIAAMPGILRLVTHPSFGVNMADGAHRHFLADELNMAVEKRFSELQKLGGLGDADIGASAKVFLGLLHTMALHHVVMQSPAIGTKPIERAVNVLWIGIRPQDSEPDEKRR